MLPARVKRPTKAASNKMVHCSTPNLIPRKEHVKRMYTPGVGLGRDAKPGLLQPSDNKKLGKQGSFDRKRQRKGSGDSLLGLTSSSGNSNSNNGSSSARPSGGKSLFSRSSGKSHSLLVSPKK